MMTKTFKVLSVNISPKKGIAKHPVSAVQLTNQGVEGDAHAGFVITSYSIHYTKLYDRFRNMAIGFSRLWHRFGRAGYGDIIAVCGSGRKPDRYC